MKCVVFWLLAAIEGLAAIILTAVLPSEGGEAFFLGLSRVRLLLLVVLLFLDFLCFFFAYLTIKNAPCLLTKKKLPVILGWFSLILVYILVIAVIILTPPVGVTASARSYFERLKPICLWAAGFCLQTFLLCLFSINIRRIPEYLKVRKGSIIVLSVTFVLMTMVVIMSVKSGVGMQIISGTFYRQGVSLLEGHLVLPLLVLFPILLVMNALQMKTDSFMSNAKLKAVSALLLSLLIWISVVLIWKETPFEGRSYFAPALRLPNSNFYPASDAENYDLLAQSILLGNGFRNGMTVVRPLYVAFLSFLHLLAGNDYMRVTDLQIIILALFPLIVYWIGRLLYHPCAGLLAAAWVTWREVYSISITPQVQVSNSRLIMSDLPMALFVSLMILAGVFWTRNNRSLLRALCCGALVGIGMLVRTQSFVLFAALLLLFFSYRQSFRSFLRNSLLSVLGLILIFAPWSLWNVAKPNEKLSGDTSESNYLLTLFENAAYPELAGRQDRKHTESLFEIISNNPEKIAEAVLSHYSNNELSSLLVLPEREISVTDSSQLFFDKDLFWYRESSQNVLEKNKALTLLYLVIISLGLAVAFQHSSWAGLFPMLIHLVYNAGTSLALNSGFRFLLPVDWIIVFYFALGCVAVLRGLIFLCTGRMHIPVFCCDDRASLIHAPQTRRLLTVCFLLLFIGLMLPLLDSVIPYRYTTKTDADLFTQWLNESDNNKLLAKDMNIAARLEAGELIICQGRAAYPRFYPAGQGDSGGSSQAKRGLNYDRMVWMLNSRRVDTVSLPIESAMAKNKIEDPQDVIVIGIQKSDYIEAISVQPIEIFGD